jgi:transcriptional regulator with AAA-type ATPase domain/tetratricopeptide (TPR) repeat protein
MAELADLVGCSPAIEAVRRDVSRLIAVSREGRRLPAILVQGETGTGKGLVAKILHRHGPRAKGPLLDVNCAAIPETLLEGELFGYERGAFTDARRAKPGLLQASSGGVLFLDEVALLPESLQAKLLTALEEQTVRRLGSTTKEAFDSWLISATNADLERAVRERRFREDLYHRLAVLTIRLPPLRARDGDAVLLADRFLDQACRDYGLPAKSLTPEARALVAAWPWPGNVRELANVMERLALLVDRRDIQAADLEAALGGGRAAMAPASPAATDEREQLLAALEATGWNIMRTAARLGLSRNTVRARMDRLGLRVRREQTTLSPPPLAETTPDEMRKPTGMTLPGASPAGSVVRWERRHVTLLRVVLAEAADVPADASRIQGLVAEKVLGFGGRIEALGRTTLDASFGVVPIENAARRAVSAALAVHKAILDASRDGAGATTVVHTEQTTIGQTGDAAMIDIAHRPALAGALDRLLERAGPGAVHVSAATAPFLERHFELRAGEPPDGATSPLFTITRPDPTGLGAWRKLARFVGRDAEMELLRNRYELAGRGRGQVVGLVGEPGVGKSRLLMEFARALDPDAALVLRLTLSPGEDPSRDRPAASLLGALFAIEPGDTPAAVRDRVAARLRALGLDAALLPPLATLLDTPVDDTGWAQLDLRQRFRRMLDALWSVVVRESLARPVVVLFEDLHWIDADTRVALDHLIETIPAARVLVILAHRPDYRHGWTGKTFYTQLRLDPLSATAADALLDDLLGEARALAPLKRQLAAWTEGNPFFIEEGVRTLFETGALAGAASSPREAISVIAQALPSTVEDTVAARIHRLPADVRHVLQCAAAIGKEFVHDVLAPVAGLPGGVLEASLGTLGDAEFVYRVAGAPEHAYTFKHALTHLVAYRSLPADRQRGLHGRILAVLEARHAGQLDLHAEALAEHASRGEAWEKAAGYLHTAGMRALSRSATRTAVDDLEHAIEALERVEQHPAVRERAIDIRLDLRYALALVGQPERAFPRLREAETIARELGDARRLGRVVSFLANGLYLLGDHAGAIASAHQAMEIAERLGDLPTQVNADIYAGRALYALGRYREAIDRFRAAVAALDGQPPDAHLGIMPVLPTAYARSYLVMALAELGEFSAALAAGREALEIADAAAHPDTIQWACYALGAAILDQGDLDGAIALLERALSICRSADLPVYIPRAVAALGHAYVLAGRPDGLALLEQAATDSEAPSQRNIQARILARLAEACVLAERTQEGADRAERALALARERGERGSEAHALRIAGLAQERLARLDEARIAYDGALALAHQLGMRPLGAMCQLALGQFNLAGARRSDADHHLALASDEFERLGMRRGLTGVTTARALRA